MLKEKFERVKRKMIYQYEGTPINLTAAISIKRMEAKKKKKEWKPEDSRLIYSKCWKIKNCQQRILCPAKLSPKLLAKQKHSKINMKSDLFSNKSALKIFLMLESKCSQTRMQILSLSLTLAIVHAHTHTHTQYTCVFHPFL